MTVSFGAFCCAVYRRQRRAAGVTVSLAQALLRRLLYGSRRRSLLGRGHPRQSLRQDQLTEFGFVLPTTTLLLLVVSLSVGAMVLRAYDQTVQAGSDRQQQAVVNAASPAVDRAKAKLDYLLDRRSDPRRPVGVPHQDQLQRLLLNRRENRTENPAGSVLTLAEESAVDPYTFPDETRLDIDGDGALDNAWRYRRGTDGGGSDATVLYGIWLHQPGPDAVLSAVQRAAGGFVRHAPLSSAQPELRCHPRQAELAMAYADAGWTADLAHPSRYRKNFQVDVYVLPDRAGQAIATLELQQERQIQQGFPWGAWFQDDLELTSEAPLALNGAMHTEGSLVVDSDDTVALLPASAPASCLSGPVRLTTGHAGAVLGLDLEPELDSSYEGYSIAGSLDRDRFGGRASLHEASGDAITLSTATDSLGSRPRRPSDLLLDPLVQLTAAQQRYRSLESADRRDSRSASPAARQIADHLYAKHEDLPLTRDRFRADDRYGPEPDIGGRLIPGKIGEAIRGDRLLNGPLARSDAQLTRNAIAADAGVDESAMVGLDGYWERRARAEGLRIIVGQRLQLEPPLLPWPGCPSSARRRCHEARQRRSLRDALAAVQSTLIYPARSADPDRPAACLLSTVHPGTAATLAASSSFSDRSALLKDYLPEGLYTSHPIVSSLFNGQGTNGWEYDALPASLQSEADFEGAIAARQPLGQALRNLAHFAGDPLGGSPSFTPPDNSPAAQVHPYPLLAAWGDFSLLRRILDVLDRPGASSYRQLSPADKTTLHSAACSLGILAYNVGYLAQFVYPEPDALPTAFEQLAAALHDLEADATLPDSPQGVLAALRLASSPDVVTLAETIALKEQVARDRRWGFMTGAVESRLGALDPLLQSLASSEPAFPALHYLFPLRSETSIGPADMDLAEALTPDAVWRDDYIAQLNQGWRYQAIDLADAATLESIAIAPRPLADWWLPHSPASSGLVLSDRALYLTCQGLACSGSPGLVRLAIKEAALFDGREMLMARVLDLDLGQLRQAQVLGHSWLPDSGIVYGFREDAVREDSINRPAQQPWAVCGQYRELTDPASGCATNAAPAADRSHDPPLSDRAISPKPVDGLPDPDRRPYGFRLRNGARLSRGEQTRGLSFVTDNPVYVMGPFNRHQSPGCRDRCPLEEFRERLPAERPYRPREFYRRHTPDLRFADLRQDDWRASEIVADSVTVLSEQFCDGSVEDAWTTAGVVQARLSRETMARYGCRNPERRTSFLNQNRPRSRPPALANDADPWRRASPTDPSSPILISPQGNPILSDGTDYAGAYAQFPDPKPLIRARPQALNAVVVSGMVPSRPRQATGGLLGQLRRLEHWETLTFSGAWVQLGYSHYATAPSDQDAWEAGSRPQSARRSRYQAVDRPRWAYDVGLQYVSAPPFVRQFETVAANPRSEFYSTPAASDPYVALLCRAAGARCR